MGLADMQARSCLQVVYHTFSQDRNMEKRPFLLAIPGLFWESFGNEAPPPQNRGGAPFRAPHYAASLFHLRLPAARAIPRPAARYSSLPARKGPVRRSAGSSPRVSG